MPTTWDDIKLWYEVHNYPHAAANMGHIKDEWHASGIRGPSMLLAELNAYVHDNRPLKTRPKVV